MNRVDLFKQWLAEQGADPKDYEVADGVRDEELDPHGCMGFRCPESVEMKPNEDGFMVADCESCPYNGFWTKEVGY